MLVAPHELTAEEIAESRQNAINATHHPSWVWDEDAISYVPPIPYPTDGNPCLWDEETLSWIPFPDYPVT